MRFEHAAGERCFVDYAGQTLEVVDPATGEVRQAQVFVAVLGASNYTFADVTWSQQMEDFLASHQRAVAAFGGVPRIFVLDNLRSGVTTPDWYEPTVNRGYQDLLGHLGAVAIPGRVRQGTGQGQGGERRAAGRALGAGAAAGSDTDRPGRGQGRGARARGPAQRAAVPEDGRQPVERVHGARPTGAAAAPDRPSGCRPSGSG